ncbi:Smg-4/UPF3-like protein [Elsinoe fawcettii]|nr:Smg-4/UPF3-like protein [Elsinoe fawcettii]
MPPKSASSANGSAPTPAGIINVNPATLQSPAAKSARLKVVVRRLPPGLTREEFDVAFGDEWKVGAGKVDWIEYRPGKIRSPGKHPDQSRAYIHFNNESHIKAYEAKFLAITFHDAKGTHRHPDLKYLPPTLEFAALQRIPTGKSRVDSRQGLIDQDPEYMAFLEGETLAIPKAPAIDSSSTDRSKETVTSTPLIEALREKKAAKAKAAAAKAAAKQPPKTEEQASPEKSKGPKGKKAKEDAKPVVKDAKSKEMTKSANKESKAPDVAAPTSSAASPPARKRERAPANIKSMLQRDLGLMPQARKGGREASQAETLSGSDKKLPPTEPAAASTKNARPRKDASVAPKAASADAKNVPPAQAAPRVPKGSASNGVAATALTPQSGNAAQAARPSKPAPKPSPGATKAYLKHANASQGVTEELLRTALATFGEVLSLEIDKRKGTALAEFKTPDALATAMAKRSVPVAQGAVEVLEYKEKPTGSGRGASSGRVMLLQQEVDPQLSCTRRRDEHTRGVKYVDLTLRRRNNNTHRVLEPASSSIKGQDNPRRRIRPRNPRCWFYDANPDRSVQPGEEKPHFYRHQVESTLYDDQKFTARPGSPHFRALAWDWNHEEGHAVVFVEKNDYYVGEPRSEKNPFVPDPREPNALYDDMKSWKDLPEGFNFPHSRRVQLKHLEYPIDHNARGLKRKRPSNATLPHTHRRVGSCFCDSYDESRYIGPPRKKARLHEDLPGAKGIAKFAFPPDPNPAPYVHKEPEFMDMRVYFVANPVDVKPFGRVPGAFEHYDNAEDANNENKDDDDLQSKNSEAQASTGATELFSGLSLGDSVSSLLGIPARCPTNKTQLAELLDSLKQNKVDDCATSKYKADHLIHGRSIESIKEEAGMIPDREVYADIAEQAARSARHKEIMDATFAKIAIMEEEDNKKAKADEEVMFNLWRRKRGALVRGGRPIRIVHRKQDRVKKEEDVFSGAEVPTDEQIRHEFLGSTSSHSSRHSYRKPAHKSRFKLPPRLPTRFSAKRPTPLGHALSSSSSSEDQDPDRPVEAEHTPAEKPPIEQDAEDGANDKQSAQHSASHLSQNNDNDLPPPDPKDNLNSPPPPTPPPPPPSPSSDSSSSTPTSGFSDPPPSPSAEPDLTSLRAQQDRAWHLEHTERLASHNTMLAWQLADPALFAQNTRRYATDVLDAQQCGVLEQAGSHNLLLAKGDVFALARAMTIDGGAPDDWYVVAGQERLERVRRQLELEAVEDMAARLSLDVEPRIVRMGNANARGPMMLPPPRSRVQRLYNRGEAQQRVLGRGEPLGGHEDPPEDMMLEMGEFSDDGERAAQEVRKQKLEEERERDAAEDADDEKDGKREE